MDHDKEIKEGKEDKPMKGGTPSIPFDDIWYMQPATTYITREEFERRMAAMPEGGFHIHVNPDLQRLSPQELVDLIKRGVKANSL